MFGKRREGVRAKRRQERINVHECHRLEGTPPPGPWRTGPGDLSARGPEQGKGMPAPGRQLKWRHVLCVSQTYNQTKFSPV